MYDKILENYKINKCLTFYNKDGKLIDSKDYDLLFNLNNYYELLCLLKNKLRIIKFLYPSIYGFDNKIILKKLTILLISFDRGYNFLKYNNIKNGKDSEYLVFNDDNIVNTFLYIRLTKLMQKTIHGFNKSSEKIKIFLSIVIYYIHGILLGYDPSIIKGTVLQHFLLYFYKHNFKNIKIKNYNELYSHAKKTGFLKEIKHDIKLLKVYVKNFINIEREKIKYDKDVKKSYMKFYKKINNNKFKKTKDDILKLIDDNFKEDKELKLYLKKNINTIKKK